MKTIFKSLHNPGFSDHHIFTLFSKGLGSGEKEGGKEKIEGCEDVRIIDKWESFSGRCCNTRLPEEDCGISSNDLEKQTF